MLEYKLEFTNCMIENLQALIDGIEPTLKEKIEKQTKERNESLALIFEKLRSKTVSQ